jgi:hypothetical protein
MLNFDKGDYIFLIKDQSGISNEHIIRVEEVDEENGVIVASEAYTVYKVFAADGSANYNLAPGFFIISNVDDKPTEIIVNVKEKVKPNFIYINIKNFDAYGKLINKELLKLIEQQKSDIIIADKDISNNIIKGR